MRKQGILHGKGCILIWIPIAFIMILIGFAPGIVMAAIVDQISPLGFGPLWGTTLTTTIILFIGFYLYDKKRFHLRYIVLTISTFIICLIYTLFDNSNFIHKIIYKLYPFLNTIIEKIRTL